MTNESSEAELPTSVLVPDRRGPAPGRGGGALPRSDLARPDLRHRSASGSAALVRHRPGCLGTAVDAALARNLDRALGRAPLRSRTRPHPASPCIAPGCSDRHARIVRRFRSLARGGLAGGCDLRGWSRARRTRAGHACAHPRWLARRRHVACGAWWSPASS